MDEASTQGYGRFLHFKLKHQTDLLLSTFDTMLRAYSITLRAFVYPRWKCIILRETLLLPGENWKISPVYTILSYNTIMAIKILLMLQNQMFLPTFKNCGGHIVDALRSLMLGLHFLFF